MTARRDKNSEDDYQTLLASVSLAARKTREALRTSDRPSIDLVKHGTKLIEAIGELSRERLSEAVEVERQAVEAAIKNWDELLRSHCVSRGLLLAGAYPDFIVEGVVYVRVNSNSASVNINAKRLTALPSDPALQAIDTEIAEAKRARKTAAETIALIWDAYEKVIKEKQNAASLAIKRASLFELLPKIALAHQSKRFLRNPVREDYVSYSIHDFRADLFALMQVEDRLEYRGHRLVLEPTSAAEDGLFMYVPALQRCAYVGHVSFVGASE